MRKRYSKAIEKKLKRTTSLLNQSKTNSSDHLPLSILKEFVDDIKAMSIV